MTVAQILSNLKKVKRGGGGWVASCPHHDDNMPSLSISYDSIKGRTLLHCHAGCSIEDVTRAIGLKPGDLYDDPLKADRWDEHDASDALTMRGLLNSTINHFDILADLEKQAWVYPLTSPGQGHRYKAFPVKGLKGGTKKLKYWFSKGATNAPYNLTNLPKGGVAYMVEGETDVWTLWQAGLDAFSFGGAAVRNMNFLDLVRAGGFSEVRIVYDNDSAGRKGAIVARDLLRQRGVTTNAYRLPQWLPTGSDVTTLYNHDSEKFFSTFDGLARVYLKGEVLRFIRDTLTDAKEKDQLDMSYENEALLDAADQVEAMLDEIIKKGTAV